MRHAAFDLFVSHTAPRDGGIKWFIVQEGTRPFNSERLTTLDEEVQTLLAQGRTVYKIKAKPALTKRLARKRPIELRPANIAPRRRRRPVESR